MANRIAKLQRLSGSAVRFELSAKELRIASEVEEARLAAVPAALEADFLKAVAVIESRGDQEQRIKVCGVLKLMVLDEMRQRFVLVGSEMSRQGLQQRFHCQRIIG